ncbi:hypothetical protein [Stenotrophomonas sp. Iso1]|uniref:hypothetical protein n=1 Tax=Stenotrophomonas sp. Iso1 TaxID=2977283 RepID=UPI0022B7B57F|nr:hypothetical protein [Stenotrophomonas sp. Iso1]
MQMRTLAFYQPRRRSKKSLFMLFTQVVVLLHAVSGLLLVVSGETLAARFHAGGMRPLLAGSLLPTVLEHQVMPARRPMKRWNYL